MKKFSIPHAWPASVEEAVALQKILRTRVRQRPGPGRVRHVAGVDIGFEDGGRVTRAAAVVLTFPELEMVDAAVIRRPTRFPYIPGLLSFREGPAALAALERLRVTPDLLLCDGQGLAHPRRFGLACHLGVLTDIPAIGAAKSRLTGKQQGVLPVRKGSYRPLVDRGERIGAVVRTRTGVRPLYVSIGHRISLPSAIDYVLRCTTRFRLPETTRLAHRLASG